MPRSGLCNFVLRAFSVGLLAIPLCIGTARGQTSALLWTTPETDAPAAAVRVGLSNALAERGMRVVNVPVTETEPAGLGRRLTIALDDYAALRLEDAARALDALVTDAATAGGADLDRARLADLFLYLALSQQELGHPDRAWDAFVRAARVDPTRALDPARVTPRAATAFRRAVAELSREPRVELTLRLPPMAHVRIDGEEQSASASISLAPGPYFVQVSCVGFETWRGTAVARPATTELAPQLVPLRPPGLDDVARPTDDVVLLALHRGHVATTWRLLLRTRIHNRSVEIDEQLSSDIGHQTRELMDEALGRRDAPIALVAAAPRRTPLVRKWWLWTSVGVAAAALAVGLGVGLTRGNGQSGGSAGGPLEPLK